MPRIDEPVFSSVLSDVSKLRPEAGSLYITGVSVEDRSDHTADWEAGCQNVTFARLTNEGDLAITFSTELERYFVRLRSRNSIAAMLAGNGYTAIYLDITGLSHRVWAPLLRGIRSRRERTYCVYVEPGDYRFSRAPTEASIFDLSETIGDVAPLPGFASFRSTVENDALFVPILGFEGPRFAFMLEEVQPKRENVFPIIGVPGFRPEYPFYTYVGNRDKLWETRSWPNVRYAAANCPFSLYHALGELADTFPDRRMIIAPIGTKPHAVGAILYHLDHPEVTEVLYDHPVRKERRTFGASRVCVYDFSLLPRIDP